MLDQAVPATTEEIDKVLDHTLKCAHRYTVVLEESAAPLFGNYPRKLLADALVNVRQHEICLKTLLHDIINCAKNVEGLQLQLAQRLDQLKATVQSKTAIPTAQVYPQFIQLATIWIGFQDELVLISVLSNVLYNLEPFAMVSCHSGKRNSPLSCLRRDKKSSGQTPKARKDHSFSKNGSF